MKKLFLVLMIFGIASAVWAHSPSDEQTGPAQDKAWEKNNVQAWLKVDIDKETKEVKFVRRNGDPEIYTKVYILKHANPYEIRPYIRNAVQDATRAGFKTDKGQKRTRVECLQYSDGVHALIVSAEDYRFEKTNLGMSMDELVELLDMPGIESSSGQKYYCYFPKYWKATELNQRIKEVGILTNSDQDGTHNPTELIAGNEKTGVDPELNALLLYINPGNIRTVAEMLKQYDRPIPEVNIKYTVYQVDLENDAKLGADFQSWRNGDGSRAFSFASRVRDGWNYSGNGVATSSNTRGNGATSAIGLSPKWNTKYLDFLKSQGAAKAVTSGAVILRNNQGAIVSANNSLLYTRDGAQLSNETLEGSLELQKNFVTSKDGVYNLSGIADQSLKEGRYCLDMKDGNGESVKLVNSEGKDMKIWNATSKKDNSEPARIQITQSTWNGTTRYGITILSGDVEIKLANGTLQREVNDLSSLKAYASAIAIEDAVPFSITFKEQKLSYTPGLTIYRDAQRRTVSTAEEFLIQFKASVSKKATVLDVNLRDVGNVVGFGDVGDPRVNKSEFKTQIHTDHNGGEFVIGGIEKETREKTVSKVPWLGDLPVIGWLLGTEGSATHKYQMVTVLEMTPSHPDLALNAEDKDAIRAIREAIVKPGQENYDYGYDQFLLDSTKKAFDPLP